MPSGKSWKFLRHRIPHFFDFFALEVVLFGIGFTSSHFYSGRRCAGFSYKFLPTHLNKTSLYCQYKHLISTIELIEFNTCQIHIKLTIHTSIPTLIRSMNVNVHQGVLYFVSGHTLNRILLMWHVRDNFRGDNKPCGTGKHISFLANRYI